jgi:hypothetical protein
MPSTFVKGEDEDSSTQTTETENKKTASKLLSIKKEKLKDICYNCVCTNTPNNIKKHTIAYAETIDWSGIPENKEFDIDEYWKNYKQKSKSNAKGYKEIIDTLKEEADTMKRSALFIPAFMNKIGREPTVDEAEIEYVSQGLNRNSDVISQNRRSRFKNCIGYYMDHYDENKRGFSSDWSKCKDEVLELIKPHLPEILEYKQGKRTKSITQEELGYIYHIIRKLVERSK